ncbi:hypothetical protein [Mesorhizobium sp.]|uniref:hypothetical protein n=1 Tax=Mesorhizobium sp. TaxID=1871066 RepID=UPI000FE34166|nr:hypothetical protein [Mesorhizobium sp.]RWG85001.1 MAG: hypothetical protein EOQ70_18010 [Mesorhizobium sp.]
MGQNELQTGLDHRGKVTFHQGAATIANANMTKDGYTCIARLPNNAKLLKRAPGPDDCWPPLGADNKSILGETIRWV